MTPIPVVKTTEKIGEKSNVEININQTSVVPWILIILAFLILLALIACCIYGCSRRKFQFVTTTPMGSQHSKGAASFTNSQLISVNESLTDLTGSK